MRPMAAKSPWHGSSLVEPVARSSRVSASSRSWAGQAGEERSRVELHIGAGGQGFLLPASAPMASLRKITWTWLHSRARLRAEAAAPFPPPNTATVLPRKNMPSQVAQ